MLACAVEDVPRRVTCLSKMSGTNVGRNDAQTESGVGVCRVVNQLQCVEKKSKDQPMLTNPCSDFFLYPQLHVRYVDPNRK